MTTNPTQPPLIRCKLPSCSTHFRRPKGAPHKDFCSANHRLRFHHEERQRALAALRAQEGHPPSPTSSPGEKK